MGEFEFLRAMFARLDDMHRCYPKEDGTSSAAVCAIKQAIKDYLSLRKDQP